MSAPHVVVIGSGLSGATAALTASARGWRVSVVDAGPGGSAFWSGVADVHGPSFVPPPDQGLERLARGASRPVASIVSVEARRAALAARQPMHPYLALGWSPADVDARVRAALEATALPLSALEPAQRIVTGDGTLRRGDWRSAGVGAFAPGDRVCVLGLDALPQFDADWIAGLLRDRGVDATAHWCAIDDLAPARSAGAASHRVAAALERGLTGWPALDGGVALLPPVLGATYAAASAHAARIESLVGCPVVEASGTTASAFGLRARDHLHHRLKDASLSPGGSVVEVLRDGKAWAVHQKDAVLRADALVLAFGGALGRRQLGGWADGWLTALPDAPDDTGRSPWSPQPFISRGVAFGPGLRAQRAGAPMPGVVVCGAALAGHDFTTDGTAFGVATSTAVGAVDTLAEDLA